MSRSAVVSNYAESLLELAAREDAVEEHGELLAEVAAFYRQEPDFRRLLETPRLTLEEKKSAMREAFAGRAPRAFVHFLLVVIEKGRQRMLPDFHEKFRDLVDEREGRVHASVTLAREPDEGFRRELGEALGEAVGREVVPHFRVDEDILGGVVVRMGDHVMNGSLRRRLADLKARLRESES